MVDCDESRPTSPSSSFVGGNMNNPSTSKRIFATIEGSHQSTHLEVETSPPTEGDGNVLPTTTMEVDDDHVRTVVPVNTRGEFIRTLQTQPLRRSKDRNQYDETIFLLNIIDRVLEIIREDE